MNCRYLPFCAVTLLSACAHINQDMPVGLLGDPAPVEAATQTIVISPQTKWVNVTGGDIVRFDVGDKSFAWAFNVGTGISRFDLSRVAPPGVLGRTLYVYMAPDPRYIGGGERDSQ
ncbi:CzcE family metal-binding protein [Noviherbaspirillum denitrificans]|uniref:CzcE family metal-binding protein n=1 Tax=Noviherbaspirillum denitrificans TaxID=1968433 RepID=A0A254TAK7_9BURK|nr:CzcE family metal-binding protein [Noviherbaspirillum denitrificans]OWW19686.1 hypothetical protein AYR66_09415 [Noviherbaspirillum denitrificans]